MAYTFLDLLSTPAVQAAQTTQGSRKVWESLTADRAFNRFTEAEAAFIAARDSFYLASVSESGWPYVQHRGGPAGFLRVLDETTLAFADFSGNRQYISLGNVAADDRVSLILVDYPNRARLKILAHMEVRELSADPELAAKLATPGYRGRPERAFVLKLEAFDWNCPQHITPRFTAGEIEPALAPLRARLAALEVENQQLRDQLATPKDI
ncbi:pyridoxamine 5'-phosphate oxidase family protein [Phenylobacterium aquaticum]|uniref:pyridoxamine 5'-phosphate oxidase family protein n=1 Tax=Phenylobacterium aquaticum TaxID=1763816 RepID=UPI0026EA2BCE|nr:pyridoxamine 5'-phosphate oxidase family protein [Phenylobacterium aquaticum]